MTVFEGLVESGQKFKPTLNAVVALTNLGKVFKRLVVGVDAEPGRQ